MTTKAVATVKKEEMAQSSSQNVAVQQSASPADLLQMAVQKDFDIDRLQRIIDMQNEWEKKQAKKEFLAALSRFQTIVPVLTKAKTANVATKTGGQFQYRYADLGSIAQTIKGALNECGLSYRWEFSEAAGKMKVTCIVSHVAGHTETATMEAAADGSGAKNDIQQKGSTHTYLQRYTLIGALGLATADDDNDGASSDKKQKKPQPGNPPADPEQADEVYEQWHQLLNECKTRVELKARYMQNKKVVDSNPKLQEMFKARQESLPANETTTMP